MRCFPSWVVLMMILSGPGASGQDPLPAPVQVPPETVQNLLVRRVAPSYPPLARQARIRGAVVLDVIVSKSGDVRDLQLVSGHPMLAPAAIDAVKQWKYRPYEKDGEPVEIQTTIQVNFKMPDETSPGIVSSLKNGGLQIRAAGVALICGSTSAGAPQRVRVSQGVMQGLVIQKIAPQYPEEARSQHIEGAVVLAVEIGKDGAVCDVALVSGHPLLAPSAIDAVRQWKYRPYLLNGQPIEVETLAQVNFTLRK